MLLNVLYEDNHLLAVAKPAGIPTMGAARGQRSLFGLAQQYIKRKYRKPGNVYLGVVSRLDALVTGVLVFARTSKAAARLTQAFGQGGVKKTYWAIVERIPSPAEGRCVDWLRKDEKQRRVCVCEAGQNGARVAKLDYRVVRPLRRGALVEIDLMTGRKHQIRVQLAHRSWPVAGDVHYGSRLPFRPGIALHARSIEFRHPTREQRLHLVAPIPAQWHAWGVVDPELDP
jgi:23S rRNA pseudouridine1911/1915/1917 synthase